MVVRARAARAARRLVWALVCATGLAGAAADASAGTVGTARLRYARGRGAEACPEPRALTAEVILRLGYDPFRDEDPRTLDVAIAVEGHQLRATLTLEAPDAPPSTHRLVSSVLDCSVLRPALGLAIALAIDPARALEVDVGPAAAPAAPPRPFPAPAPAPASAHVGTEDPRPPRGHDGDAQARRRLRPGSVYAGAYVAVAAAPTTTGGVSVGGAIALAHASVGAELRGDMPVAARHGAGDIEVGRVLVQAVPCFRTIVFGFGLCGLAAVGLTIARGHGYVVSRDVLLPYVALGGRILVEIPVAPRLALGLHADVLGLVTRAALAVDGSVLYRDAPVAGVFGATLVARFGDGR